MDKKSRKIVVPENTMKTVFQNLLDEFEDKTNLVDDLD